jgi:hypothetical protein
MRYDITTNMAAILMALEQEAVTAAIGRTARRWL